MSQRHAAQGEEHWKAAQKALKTSMFKWSPDHMTAAHNFERAAASFRLSQDYNRASKALTHSADEHYKLGNTLQSALTLEKAAEATMQSVNRSKETISLSLALFERATYRFRESGDLGKAAGCLVKSARAVVGKPEGDTPQDKQKGLELYGEACTLLRGSGKESVNLDVFRNGFSLAVSAGDIKYADIFNKDLIAISTDLGQSGSINKCFLNMIIIRLASGDVVAARQEFESHFDDTGFLKSDEADVAENLLRAYDSNDDDKVKAIVKKNVVFRFLDHQVTKLARQLDPLKGSILAASSSSTVGSVKASMQPMSKPSSSSAAAAYAGVGVGSSGGSVASQVTASSLSASEALFHVAAAPKVPQRPNDLASQIDVKPKESQVATSSDVATPSVAAAAAAAAIVDVTEQPHAVVSDVTVGVKGLVVAEEEEEGEGEEENDSMEAMMRAAREAALNMAKQEEENAHDDELDFLK